MEIPAVQASPIKVQHVTIFMRQTLLVVKTSEELDPWILKTKNGKFGLD